MESQSVNANKSIHSFSNKGLIRILYGHLISDNRILCPYDGNYKLASGYKTTK